MSQFESIHADRGRAGLGIVGNDQAFPLRDLLGVSVTTLLTVTPLSRRYDGTPDLDLGSERLIYESLRQLHITRISVARRPDHLW